MSNTVQQTLYVIFTDTVVGYKNIK